MGEMLVEYERKRAALIDSLKELGDFRRGTITVNYRKCGENQLRMCEGRASWTWSSASMVSDDYQGKSYAKSVKLGPEMQKYLEEIANHDRFLKLCEEIVEVNERYLRSAAGSRGEG